MNKTYQIIFTESAVRDLEEKADYISLNLRDPDLAETWYLRLRAEIIQDLRQFPFKYPPYSVGEWGNRGIRQFVFRNDVVLYSIDEKEQIVYIRMVCTKGRDVAAHIAARDLSGPANLKPE